MMLDTVTVDGNPRVLAFLPYRVMRRGKVPVSKSACRDREQVAMRTGVIPERRPAGRAEMKIGFIAAVADMLIDLMLAADRHCIGRKTRLCGKGRPTSFLAIIAMADRDADRLASAGGGELAAAAGGGAGTNHGFAPPTSVRLCNLHIHHLAKISIAA